MPWLELSNPVDEQRRILCMLRKSRRAFINYSKDVELD